MKGQNGPFTPTGARRPLFSTFCRLRRVAAKARGLLPNETHPDEVERSTHADQEADQGQKAGVEEAVSGPANSAPEEKA